MRDKIRNDKKKVLISGGRSPYTLELIRLFKSAGFHVVALEFFHGFLSQYSSSTDESIIITAPNKSFETFKIELLEILKNGKFHLVISTCEEVFHFARLKEEINLHSRFFGEDLAILKRLHDKLQFIVDADSRGITVPRTFRASEYKNELSDKKIVLKRIYSRFASEVYILSPGMKWPELPDLHNWIVQEFIPGQEASIYTVVNSGKVSAESCYLKKYAIDGGATLMFEHTQLSIVQEWINNFFNGTDFTGQFSFDVIIANEKVIPIECNPRATSGVHLFSEDERLVSAFFGETDRIRPDLNSRSMLAMAMIIYTFSVKKLTSWTKDFMSARDVVFRWKDPFPFFTQFWALGLFAFVAWKKKVKIIAASTLDIEYNGD